MSTLRLSLIGTVILALLGGLGGVVVAQDGPADSIAPLTKEGAVARVLASDPRFADLPDWLDLRTEGFANFEALVLENAYYRVLTTVDGEMTTMESYWVAPNQPSSRIVEVTLVRDCAKWRWPGEAGVEGWDGNEAVLDDPCEWRHSWYYRVQPEGTVTLLFDEGDPDDSPAD